MQTQTREAVQEFHGEAHPVAAAESNVGDEWEDVVLALKKEKGVDNPWAVANAMKKKGYQRRNEAGEPYDASALISRWKWDRAKELSVGAKQEREHTDDPAEARDIAEDHLEEDPHYYEKLDSVGLIECFGEACEACEACNHCGNCESCRECREALCEACPPEVAKECMEANASLPMGALMRKGVQPVEMKRCLRSSTGTAPVGTFREHGSHDQSTHGNRGGSAKQGDESWRSNWKADVQKAKAASAKAAKAQKKAAPLPVAKKQRSKRSAVLSGVGKAASWVGGQALDLTRELAAVAVGAAIRGALEQIAGGRRSSENIIKGATTRAGEKVAERVGEKIERMTSVENIALPAAGAGAVVANRAATAVYAASKKAHKEKLYKAKKGLAKMQKMQRDLTKPAPEPKVAKPPRRFNPKTFYAGRHESLRERATHETPVTARRIEEFARLREAQGTLPVGGDFHAVDVVLITEGPGNKRDRNFYPSKALIGSVEAFKGTKCFLNHPSKSEENDRPERDVRELCGWFSNVRVARVDDKNAIVGTLNFSKNEAGRDAKQLIESDLEFRRQHRDDDKVFVGLSINAEGPSHDEVMDGDSWNVVDGIEYVMSTDIVTFPARGGRVLGLREAETQYRQRQWRRAFTEAVEKAA